MKSNEHRIIPLDHISQSKIRSAVRISSLNEIVIELVKNALDAKATSVNILLNYATGFCSVQDNGSGIAAQEFVEGGRLAEIYCSSKTDKYPNVYGRYGRHLAAISGIALLSISSRRDDETLHTLWLDETGRLGQYAEDGNEWHAACGTKVKVYNLFAKFPVRRKHLAQHFSSVNKIEKTFDQLKYDLSNMILAFPGLFDVDVRLANSCHKFSWRPARQNNISSDCRNPHAACALLRQLGYVDQLQGEEWQPLSISSPEIDIHAFIHPHPSPHKLAQFISVNRHSLTKRDHPAFFQLANTVLEFTTVKTHGISSSSNEMPTETPSKRLHFKQRREQKVSVDRWPMFVIWIDTKNKDMEAFCELSELGNHSERFTSRVSLLMRTMFSEYLTSRGLAQSTWSQVPTNAPVNDAVDRSLPTTPWDFESFGDWSRVKSSGDFAIGDLLSGLPFRHSEDVQTVTPTDSSNALEEETDITVALPHRCHAQSQTHTSDDIVIWTEPQTGNPFRIDPRTGIVLPECASDATHDPILTHQKKRQKNKSFPQVAQNARKHLHGLRCEKEAPIRSMALLGSATHHLNEFRSDDRMAEVFALPKTMNSFEDYEFEFPRMSKRPLKNMIVLGQVAKKFILTVVPYAEQISSQKSAQAHVLVLLDQHAADERIKIEMLLRSFYDKIAILENPIIFEPAAEEVQLLQHRRAYFEQLHIFYDIVNCDDNHGRQNILGTSRSQIHLTALPEAIAERCRVQPSIIINLIREEIWSDNGLSASSGSTRVNGLRHCNSTADFDVSQHSIAIASNLPARLLDLLNSRACRSAIMFNDELTKLQCATLVSTLAECTLPFQCAHGRPSMVTLADISRLAVDDPLTANESSLRDLDLGSSADASQQPRFRDHIGGLNSVNEQLSFGNAYMDWIREEDNSGE